MHSSRKRRPEIHLGVVSLLASLHAGCGGGGGGGGASDPPQSPPPPATPPPSQVVGATPTFADATAGSGIAYVHGYQVPSETDTELFSGGVAAGDYDGDGDTDLFVVRGDVGPNLLYRNDGNLIFMDVAESAGLAYTRPGAQNDRLSGPTFADMDGDGDLDLFIGGFEGSPSFIYENNGDGSFADVSEASGIRAMQAVNSVSAAFGDYDKDGDLDMFIAHWGTPREVDNPGDTEHLWRNISDANGIRYESVSVESGIAATIILNRAGVLGSDRDYTFAPTFADFNDDGYPDILSVADFTSSRVFLNNQDGTFSDVTDEDVIIDDSGMGSAVGDYDNDGDLDWFVSSINSAVIGSVIGNRLYRNVGGVFEDATDEAGVSDGSWGWAACFLDTNNDQYLDIFHVNGWRDQVPETFFATDFSPLFVALGDGSFDDMAGDAGIVDQEQGRGLVCADFDQDGDIDLFITHRDEENSATLYRNDTDNGNWLTVELAGAGGNTQAAGARIEILAGGIRQMREIVIGSNFTSQNPTEQLFGIGSNTQVDSVTVTWPDGSQSTFNDVAANQRVTYSQQP